MGLKTAAVAAAAAVLTSLSGSAAFAATPREGLWEVQSLDGDRAVEVRLVSGEVLLSRTLHREFNGEPYTLEHLYRGKAGEGRLTFKLFARDDPKLSFEELREVGVLIPSAEEIRLDDTILLFREGLPSAAGAPAAAPTPAAVAAVAAAAPPPPPAAAPTATGSWSSGIGYLSRIVRHSTTSSELLGLFKAISVSKEGEAALAAGDEAFAKKDFKQAAAAYETALAAGVPVSRLAPKLSEAWLSLKDCARAEKMIGRAQRLDPDGKQPAELAQALKKACPGAKLAAAPARLDRAAAAKIVAALEAQSGTAHRLANPRSYDDESEVLKLDQLTLFPAAVAYISTQKDVRAQALLAQMELAWAESLQQLAEIDENLAGRFRELIEDTTRGAASGGLSAEEFRHLASLKASAADSQQTSEALRMAAADHLARGLEVARAVIKQSPADYLGYRVAADYYRLQGDWRNFDAMLAKIEKTNAGSNGLVFLKGVAAYQRGRNGAEATRLLRAAVANDPRFARAQAHLVMLQPSLEETWAEFGKLKQMSPAHPIVLWTGPALEKFRAEAQ
ncbi:MAG TPA: hypothetical protein VGK67_35160 [Myxococcales bacterium]